MQKKVQPHANTLCPVYIYAKPHSDANHLLTQLTQSLLFPNIFLLNMWNSWGLRQVEVPMTEDQIKRVIQKLDKNGDGKICRRELKAGFKSLGLRFACFRARRALRNADANRDGFISEEEINELARYVSKWGISLT